MGKRRDRVRSYLATQTQAVRAGDHEVRGLTPAAVHDVRVAVRRTRSVLRVFGRVPGDGVEAPLERWSDVLGAVREPEALRETLASVCSEALLAEVTPGIDAEARAAGEALRAEIDTAEHRWLLEQLAALAVRDLEAPLKAGDAARKAARKALRRLRRAAKSPQDERLVHRARKAAKRARYAAEAIGDRKGARGWRAVQNDLGEHRDALLAVERLAEVPGDEAKQVRAELGRRAQEALARQVADRPRREPR